MHLEKGVNEPMSAWIGQMKSLSYKLEGIGMNVTDEDWILVLTNRLDNSYEPFVILLNLTQVDQLTLDYMVDHLLNEEVRRSNKGAGGEASWAQTRNSIYLMQGSGQSRHGSIGGRSPGGCWHCGKLGHVQAFCKEVREGGRHVANFVGEVSALRELGV